MISWAVLMMPSRGFFVLESTVGLLCCTEICDDWLQNLTSSCWRGSLQFPAQQRVKYFAATIRQCCWVQHKHRQVKILSIFCRFRWFSLTLPSQVQCHLFFFLLAWNTIVALSLALHILSHDLLMTFSFGFFLHLMELLVYQIMLSDTTLVVGSYIQIEKKQRSAHAPVVLQIYIPVIFCNILAAEVRIFWF